MTINTNNILNNLNLSLTKISSPDKTNDNTTDKMMHDNLQSDMLQSQQEILNFNDAVGYMQVADGVLSNISKQTDELNTLSVASNNGILSNDQKSMINSQMQDISNNISKTLTDTTFNGKNVFSSNFQINDTNINLNINNNIDLSNQDSILDFQKQIDSKRSDISSFMNSANSNIDNLSQKVVNEANSKSNFEQDIANNVNDINKNNLQLNASLLAQSHNTDILANSMKELLG